MHHLPRPSRGKDHVHTWGSPVYTWADDFSSVTASRTCEDCGKAETETAMTSSEVTKPASCEAAGESKCTAVFGNEAFSPQEKVIEAPKPLGHDWGPWTVTKKATLTQKGTEERTCSRCGKKQTRSTEKLSKQGSSSRTGKARKSSPRTGDESHVMVWISLAVICAAGLAALLRFRRRSG